MSAISPVHARAFVLTMINKFDQVQSENINFTPLDSLSSAKNRILTDFENKESPTAQDVKDLNSAIYKLFKQTCNLSDLFALAQWLDPPEESDYDQETLFNDTIKHKLTTWGVSFQEGIAPQAQLYRYVFLKTITQCTPGERDALFAQLDNFRVHLDSFGWRQQRLIYQVQNLFVRWSQQQKEAFAWASLAAAVLMGYFAFPPVKAWVKNVVLSALVSYAKLYGPASLVKLGESIYQRSQAFDEYFLKMISSSAKVESAFSISEWLVRFIAHVQICSWSSVANLFFSIDYICDCIRAPNIINVMHMGLTSYSIYPIVAYPIVGMGGQVRQTMLAHQIPLDSAMKAYQVWTYLMIAGPSQGLLKTPRDPDSGGTG